MELNAKRKRELALLCGLLGCLCLGTGDWLMLYGDTAHQGSLFWLTEGAAAIPAWRNGLAMALSFPGILLYGIALFATAALLKEERQRCIYRYLTAFSLTPWLALHLFYILILYGFAWMNGNGYEAAALPVSEAVFGHLSWIVVASEGLMLPPYFYWAYLLLRGKSHLPRWMAFANPLVFYGILKAVTLGMPDGTFRLAFTNGLMSEGMALWFSSMLIWLGKQKEGCEQ